MPAFSSDHQGTGTATAAALLFSLRSAISRLAAATSSTWYAPAGVPVAHGAFVGLVPHAQRVVLGVPRSAEGPIEWRYLAPDAPHDRAFDVLRLAPDGTVVAHERFRELAGGRRAIAAIYPLHVGSYFGLPGRILVMLAALSLPLFAITGWYLYLTRRRMAQARRIDPPWVGGRTIPEP